MEIIKEYMGRLEKAAGLAEKNGLSRGLVNGIRMVKDVVNELEPLVTEKNVKKAKLDLDKLTDSLVSNCEKGEESPSVGDMRQLRDKARFLKHQMEK